MGNMMINETAGPIVASGTLASISIWAILFCLLLFAIGLYVVYVLTHRHEEKKRIRLKKQLEQEHAKEEDMLKQQVLTGVSQELLAPIALIISPLQQLASEPLTDDVSRRVHLILRNAQLLLHQVNLLSTGNRNGAASPLMEGLPPVMQQMSTTIKPTPMEATKPSETSNTTDGVDDSNAAHVTGIKSNETANEEEETTERFTMLMVDDSPDMCRFVHDYFRGEYDVLTASNGEQALERLQENDSIDLVVSDVTMPKMDGLELCKHIKTDLRWSHIPVILLTGRQNDQLEVEGLRMGADDYITKPFNVEMLRLRVKKFIEKKENRQRQFRENMNVMPSEITITSVDEQFIQQAIKICEDHISDTEFSVEALGHELSLSRTYLYKKLINITGKGPAEFIRTIRLKRGKQYLEQTTMSISDIAAALGYSTPKRFTENFKAEYGMSPSEYAKKTRAERSVKITL